MGELHFMQKTRRLDYETAFVEAEDGTWSATVHVTLNGGGERHIAFECSGAVSAAEIHESIAEWHQSVAASTRVLEAESRESDQRTDQEKPDE